MTGRIAIVGAGVSGLAAAQRLRTLLGPAAEIVVLEQRGRVGGVLHTVDLAGVPFDVGAEAFLARRPEVPALVAELGLTDRVVHPTAASPTIRAGGRTVGMPAGTLMGVPTATSDLSAVLSPAARAEVAAERTRPLTWRPGQDASLGAVLRDRLGDEVAERLVEPLLGGVYAGRVDSLGLRATIPQLARALDEGAPSLTTAATTAVTPAPPRESPAPDTRVPHIRQASSPDRAPESAESGGPRVAGPQAGPVFGALTGGYATLLDALVGAAKPDLRLGTTVRALIRTPGGWRLTLGPATSPEHLDVDAVVLAVPAPAAARLLAGAPAARPLGEIELASSAVVALAYDGIEGPETSGVLVAADEPLAIKAATHSSRKWAHVSPDGLVRLRVSMGRFGEATTLRVPDDELVARARRDLATLHGITADPVATHVQRWGGGLPQYAVGHGERVAAIEAARLPGLEVVGAALHGVGVAACVATARAAAERIAATLSA